MRRAACAAVVAAIGLTGCGIDKADEQSRQLDVIGDVQVRTTICTSGDADRGKHACATFSHTHRGQVLVGYRIPVGSEAPDEFEDDFGRLSFTRDESYGNWLDDSYPEAGMHWVGFVTAPHTQPAGTQAAVTLSPRLTLPDAGKPFAGPYRYSVVVGYRELTDPFDEGTAGFDCTGDGDTVCASTAPGADSEQPTRDLAVRPGGVDPPTVVPGGQVSVPFALPLAGAGVSDAHFDLAASTDLAGARVDLSAARLSPDADTTTPVATVVSVPAEAPVGTYTVRLEASVTGEPDVIIQSRQPLAAGGGGGTVRRSGTMTFRVVAPPHVDPPQVDPPAVKPPPVEPPAVEPPPIESPRGPVPPATASPPAPAPAQPETPLPPAPSAPGRARFRLALSALPRRAYGGDSTTYLLVARNASARPALRARVCEALPRRVQYVDASRAVFFRGRSVCFDRRTIGPGESVVALVYVHVDVDAPAGMVRAHATAVAANADRARARAGLRVLRRAPAPQRAPVTG
jgi:hypothetical protein